MVSRYFGFSLFMCFFKFGVSVPIDFCLHPLNKSDCHMQPVSVFSYYKPGSRCEIETWRGCPTLNKFEDEFLCSHYCIGKLFRSDADNEVDDDAGPCQGTLDVGNCHKPPTPVYTFRNNECLKAIWRGCKSSNRFQDEETCIHACIGNDTGTIDDQLNDLSSKELAEVDDIIDNVLDDNEKEIVDSDREEETPNEPSEEIDLDEIEQGDKQRLNLIISKPSTDASVEEATTTTEAVTEVTTAAKTEAVSKATEEVTEAETTTEATEAPTTTEPASGDADEVITT